MSQGEKKSNEQGQHFLIRLHPLIYPSFKHYPNTSHVMGSSTRALAKGQFVPLPNPPRLMIKSVSFLISMLAFCKQQSWCSSGVSHWEHWGRVCVKSEPKFPSLWSLEQQPKVCSPRESNCKSHSPDKGLQWVPLNPLSAPPAHSHGFYSHLKTTKSHHPTHSRGHCEGSLWFQQILNPRDDTMKSGVNWLCLFPSIFYTQ